MEIISGVEAERAIILLMEGAPPAEVLANILKGNKYYPVAGVKRDLKRLWLREKQRKLVAAKRNAGEMF